MQTILTSFEYFRSSVAVVCTQLSLVESYNACTKGDRVFDQVIDLDNCSSIYLVPNKQDHRKSFLSSKLQTHYVFCFAVPLANFAALRESEILYFVGHVCSLLITENRSISYCRFEEGAKQFRDDVAVNPNDTEEVSMLY